MSAGAAAGGRRSVVGAQAEEAAAGPEQWEMLESFPSFRLPAFARFSPASRRPGIDVLEERGRQWLAGHLREAYDSQEAFDGFLEHRTTLWNLLVYATAREDRIALICHWIDVLFSIDDAFAHASPGRLKQLGVHLLPAVLAGQEVVADTAYPRAFRMLRDESRAVMPAGVWGRLASTLKGFLDACRFERETTERGTVLDLVTYEKSRGLSIGECCFPLAEFGLGIDLTETLARLPELYQCNRAVCRHWIGVNDIFSYRKELYSGDTINEIELALADNGGDLQAAVDRIAATVHRVEEEFDRIVARLRAEPAGQDRGVVAYLDALHRMIAGNLEWSYLTPRYNGRGHNWSGHTDATVVLTPHRTLYLPAGSIPNAFSGPHPRTSGRRAGRG